MGQCGSELHATTGDLRPAIAFDNAVLDSEFTFLSYIQSFNAVPLRIINGIIPRNPRSIYNFCNFFIVVNFEFKCRT
jgi:hypothetical protein